jgi:hypothetical protein
VNYIQRLLDTAAPTAAPAAVALPATASPVLAADQRLGLFPGLVDSFSVLPAAGDAAALPPQPAPGPMPTRTPSAAPGAAEAAPQRRAEPASAVDAPAAAASSATAPTAGERAPPPRHVSPLQRLVESAPLAPPRRRTPAQAEAEPSAAAATVNAAQAPPSSPAPIEAPVMPFPAPAAVELAEPFRITADQFRPRETATAAPAPRPAPAHPDLEPLAPARSQTARIAEPRSGAPAIAPAPLLAARAIAPTPHDAPSPFARMPAPPPPLAPAAEAREVERAPPERVIERIREVPVRPHAPPPAMTAAAQSVIGSLSGHRFGRWQPRQEGW